MQYFMCHVQNVRDATG